MNSPKEKKKRNKRVTYQIDQAIIENNIQKLDGGIENNRERYDFAIRLNELLTDKEKDQENFAKNVNISVGSLSNYRNGTREPTLTTLVKMANELDVSVDYLTGKSDCPDYKIEKINKKIGLSQKAIKTLYKLQHEYFEFHEDFEVDIEENRKISKRYQGELEILSSIIADSMNLIDLLRSMKENNNKRKEYRTLLEEYKKTKDKDLYLKLTDIRNEIKRQNFNVFDSFNNIMKI